MSEYVIPLGMIPETPEELGAYIFDAYKWRGIVRCRDCKHANFDCSVCYREGEIGDDLYYPEITPDGFCSWGERV